MLSTVANFFVTSILTLLAGITLVFTYYRWARPVLLRHNIIPLQHLPATLSQRFSNRRRRRGHVRLPSEDFDEDPDEWSDGDGRLSRDLEEGFAMYRDDDEEVGPAQEMGAVVEQRAHPEDEEAAAGGQEEEEEEEERGRKTTRSGEEPPLL